MLHALVDYARSHQLAAEPGFEPKAIRWLLGFRTDGQYLDAVDTTESQKNSKGREFPCCPKLTQPEIVAAGGGCRPFLVDGLDVVLLLTKGEAPDDKLLAKHGFFVDLLGRASSVVPELAAIAATLSDESKLAAIRRDLLESKAKAKPKPNDLATFAIFEAPTSLPRIIVESTDWHDWWRAFRNRLAEARKAKSGGKRSRNGASDARMRCFLSGELVEPLATHGKINGLADVGGLSPGDALTSFDKEAFRSFGLEQGANAAMSAEMAETYRAALNHLIKNRSVRLPCAKVVYWYSSEVKDEDDVLSDVVRGFEFGDAEIEEEETASRPTGRDRAQSEGRARRLLQAIRTGERPDLRRARYFALTLSANSGRVVIRDWMEGQFEELAANVDAWFKDLAIVRRDGGDLITSHKLGAVLAAPVRQLSDVPAPLVTTVWRRALLRLPIPYQLMAQTLRRVVFDIVQDEPARHARLGLLKAYCNRQQGVPDMTERLNEHETHPAYLCGRIMALLAAIQRRALGDVGATVVQRYYAAASATPALVLGRLVRMAQIAHLPKITPEGLRIWFDQQLTKVWDALTQAPPRILTLEEQTLFAMGYYQQQARRGKDEDTRPSGQQDAASEE